MNKNIDIKNRVVNLYDVDTNSVEDEVIGYLDRQMKVRFHSAYFNNKRYVFMGKKIDAANNSITVSSYRKRTIADSYSVVIE